MMDDLDWEQHCRAFDGVARAHRDSPLPKRALADHHRIFMARLKADQAASGTEPTGPSNKNPSEK